MKILTPVPLLTTLPSETESWGTASLNKRRLGHYHFTHYKKTLKIVAYVCHWPLTAENRVQFRSVDVEFVSDRATGLSCPPTTVKANPDK